MRFQCPVFVPNHFMLSVLVSSLSVDCIRIHEISIWKLEEVIELWKKESLNLVKYFMRYARNGKTGQKTK